MAKKTTKELYAMVQELRQENKQLRKELNGYKTQEAAAKQQRHEAAKKAAVTRKRRAAARKAVATRRRRAAARKAVATRQQQK